MKVREFENRGFRIFDGVCSETLRILRMRRNCEQGFPNLHTTRKTAQEKAGERERKREGEKLGLTLELVNGEAHPLVRCDACHEEVTYDPHNEHNMTTNRRGGNVVYSVDDSGIALTGVFHKSCDPGTSRNRNGASDREARLELFWMGLDIFMYYLCNNLRIDPTRKGLRDMAKTYSSL